MPASRTWLLLLLLALLPSCATWFFDPADTSTSDYLALHPEPRPGDWALHHLNQDGRVTKIRWTVLAVDDAGVLVRREFVDAPEPSMQVEYLLSPAGQVRQAWLVYEGERHPQRVIPKDEPGGYEDFRRVERLPSDPLEVPAGRFVIDGVETYDYTLDVIFMTYDATTIDYLSSAVPFALVERRRLFDADAGLWLTALETTTYAGDALHSGRYDKLLNLADHTGDVEGVDIERLVAFGFGDAAGE